MQKLSLEQEKKMDIDLAPLLYVKIGTQCWMPKNLNVNKFRNGDLIPEALTFEDWNSAGPHYCYYNFNHCNGRVYGKLYNRAAVTDKRELAPEGWHIPDNKEWLDLIDFLGGPDEAGGKLKENKATHWASPNLDADDSSHFKALPGGWICSEKLFQYMHTYGFWWSKDLYEHDLNGRKFPAFLTLSFESDKADFSSMQFDCGLSVRCIRDIHHQN